MTHYLLAADADAFFAGWFWLTVLIGVVWLRRHIDIWRAGRDPVLRPDEQGLPVERLPALTVLVAGKDEDANIGRCIEGLLAQNYPRLQIIVINDRSRDRTGEIMDSYAARDPRVTAVHVSNLPEGWFGKNHAMHVGVRRATGDWLCFSDADCEYDSSQLMASAVRLARREGVDFLSVLPRLEAGSFWERVVQPAAGGILVFWFPPGRVNSPRSATAYANGAFMLLSRTAYERVGGHEAIRGALNEDMHLARRAKSLGLRLYVIRGADMYRVRMYTSIRQIWNGWTRIFYGCFGTPLRLTASLLMLAVFSVSPYVALAVSPWAGDAGTWLAGAGLFAVASQMSVLTRFYGMTGNGRLWAFTYPLGAAFVLGIIVNAMRRLSGTPTEWRGTSYVGGAQTLSETPANTTTEQIGS